VGYNLARSEQPNLILSDVMMPVVDGLEMCRRLKSNEETAHIPVIILTAKNSEQLKLFSTKLGADEYVSKPFDPEYLKSRAANLLNAQDLMRNRFSRKVTLAPTDIEISDYEEKLIMQAKEIVEQNLENVHFNAEMLATGLGMSHSTLYRKLKALTGYSIVGFINKMKIERAAQLMQNKEMTITEIMYKVGFNDLKHFRKCFQKEFHQSPSDYRKNLGA
jgi:YesN/AraC family two-component response regulator